MMVQQSSVYRRWAIAPMALVSILTWLAVSSDRNGVLHAIGKLGIEAKGYGSVNLFVLAGALVWSFGSVAGVIRMYDVRPNARGASCLCLGALLLVAVTSGAGIFWDYQFSMWPIVAFSWQLFEMAAAAALSWIAFCRPANLQGLVGFCGSIVLGLSALAALTASLLLACPYVILRI